MSEALDHDVVIIGGGPAGAGMAAYLAKSGIDCLVLESELFPRPHVGESLVPSSTRVFKDLGFLEKMEEARFPHKYGAVWTSAENKSTAFTHDMEGLGPDCHAQIKFSERPQPGVDRTYTYHVDRGKFDLLLLQHAQELGAKVHTGIKATGVQFTPDRAITTYTVGRREVGISSRVVIDASGRRTVVGNQLHLKQRDTVFDQYAIHTWFEDFDRLSAAKADTSSDYIFVHFLPMTNSWVWQIPITDKVTSVGVVTQKKHFAKSKASREAFFWECVSTRPELSSGLRKAKQLRPLTEEGDYSYAMSQICGDRFVLVGDAARFVDPIFSTGVSIALNSARFASRDVIKALEVGDFSRKAYSDYEQTIRRGTKNWYDFISVYYRLNVLFTYFINNPTYRLDVLKLLQGDVYDEEQPAVLEKMRKMVAEVEEKEDHVWHKLLGNLTGDAFRPQF